MSQVFKALDRKTDQLVAVKILREDRTQRERFRREAEKLSLLSHPHVVGFHEFGEFEGRDFLVMEYMPGGNLAEILEQETDLDRLLDIFTQVATGLQALHQAGLVHRDLKPENVLLTAHGLAKIGDLGVAREVKRQTRLTEAGAILGTYLYVSPEQILSSDVGPTADLYSLGVCLFEAICKELPFEGSSEYEVLHAHVQQPAPRVGERRPDLPAELDQLVEHLLAKKPEDRPQTAAEVRSRLMKIRQLLLDPVQPVWAAMQKSKQVLLLGGCARERLLALEELQERLQSAKQDSVLLFSPDPRPGGAWQKLLKSLQLGGDEKSAERVADSVGERWLLVFEGTALDPDSALHLKRLAPLVRCLETSDEVSALFEEVQSVCQLPKQPDPPAPSGEELSTLVALIEGAPKSFPYSLLAECASFSEAQTDRLVDELVESGYLVEDPGQAGSLWRTRDSGQFEKLSKRRQSRLNSKIHHFLAQLPDGLWHLPALEERMGNPSAAKEAAQKAAQRAGELGLREARTRFQALAGTTADAPESPLNQLGGFLIEEKIKDGDTATIYAGRRESLDRKVALKVLRADLVDDPTFRERFRREAKAAAQLRHPNIVEVYDFGEQDSSCYLALEFLGEQTLKNLEIPLPVAELKPIAVPILKALQHLHERGIIHRNLRPENIFLPEPERPVLGDFSVARMLADSVRLTRAGETVGQSAYAPPEQLEGKDLQPNADLYALGLILVELLTGENPHDANNILSSMEKKRQPKFQLEHELPEPLLKLLEKVCHPDPTQRHQCATDFREELVACLDKLLAPLLLKIESGEISLDQAQVLRSSLEQATPSEPKKAPEPAPVPPAPAPAPTPPPPQKIEISAPAGRPHGLTRNWRTCFCRHLPISSGPHFAQQPTGGCLCFPGRKGSRHHPDLH